MLIYFYTSGCKVNQYETQVLREQLCINGNTLTENIKEADICVINSCTVTHNADADCRQVARRILRVNPRAKIIVTGCYAVSSKEEIEKLSPNIKVFADKSKLLQELKHDRTPAGIESISSFHKHSRAFVKIQDGCDAFCSYCIVPRVRTKMWSKPKEPLFAELEALIKNGYQEVVLCGIRLGKYENGKNYKLTNLVKDIISNFDNLKVHFSSLEIAEITGELLELMLNLPERIVRHFHIPLQSGDDEILKKMKRPYSSKTFGEKIKYIYSRIPNIEITTDVIVGFPGETLEQFNNTLEFVKRNKFSKLHVFRYSPRKGTPASAMPDKVGPVEIKRRAKAVQIIYTKLMKPK
ncbi:MAG: tRNA (N(6)-L-threonylcarbamoyladenosine(37)-C(2))-methylthiotransferase MtaB [Elusimicrobia bacterium]|nr:tRNA (N(6)-L-threonylcarbamoyladenosine(37)-C(2))-methylthiotransferase MtaB [Elusimicrobiota bacterium]MBU2614115.1 tRNA (N(6)-L-threonylcarbamoyladenosine(37)-C(2))-methylthiotransferase MtaB [Elusimicrobiota bacterium]